LALVATRQLREWRYVTPASDPPDDDWTSADGGGSEASEERRRRFMRRRVTAAAAGLLVVVWIASLFSSGGSGRTSTRPSLAAPPLSAAARAANARHDAALAAQRAREEQAIQSALGYTAFVTAGSAGRREIALTFDDGPGPSTPQVIATLQRLHAPATFFLVGRSIAEFGSQVPAEQVAGFAIGNHTRDHSPMATLSRQDQVSELLDQARALRAYGVPFPHLFRPPYGSFNATTLAITKKLKMLTILWTIDTKDFSQPGVDVIVKAVISGARPGAIVLMHDAGGPRAQTVAALPRIVAGLRHRGYTLVTVPRLLADDPPLQSQEVPPSGLSGG
jgi:peptidoglycan/xylan/chitin deacetylase (PgdA/CDA1 family)